VDEITRLASDVGQLTKRVDDMTLRLAIVENEQKYVDEKIADIKVLIIEKNQDLRTDFTRDLTTIKTAVDTVSATVNSNIANQGRYAFWFITVVGGTLLVSLLNLIMKSGLMP
jgi:CHASE3 domain sensor protein